MMRIATDRRGRMSNLIDRTPLFLIPIFYSTEHENYDDYQEGWNDCNNFWIKNIKDQPTAYDLDKVVQQLEEFIAESVKKFDYGISKAAYTHALEIVERGGKMSRLTKRTEDGKAMILLYSDPNDPKSIGEEIADKNIKVIKKLARYEDLEEPDPETGLKPCPFCGGRAKMCSTMGLNSALCYKKHILCVLHKAK